MSEYKVRQAEQGVENGISELERAVNELKGSWGNTAKSFQGFADSAGDLADRLGSQANLLAWGSVFFSGLIAGFILARRRESLQSSGSFNTSLPSSSLSTPPSAGTLNAV